MSKNDVIENIDEDTIVISEPRHPQENNCYLLKGTDRAVLIDTGLGIYSMGEVILELTDLPVLVLTTHAHWDHIGSHWDFEKIAIHPEEFNYLKGGSGVTRERLFEMLYENGWKAPGDFVEDYYDFYDGGADFVFEDGDVIEFGGRKLRVLHTPGHSHGHCCFYEADRGYLFSGDLAYEGPLLAGLRVSEPEVYRASLHRIDNIDFRRLLPGHNSLNTTHETVTRMCEAFDELHDKELLKIGAGTFDFGSFSIVL